MMGSIMAAAALITVKICVGKGFYLSVLFLALYCFRIAILAFQYIRCKFRQDSQKQS